MLSPGILYSLVLSTKAVKNVLTVTILTTATLIFNTVGKKQTNKDLQIERNEEKLGIFQQLLQVHQKDITSTENMSGRRRGREEDREGRRERDPVKKLPPSSSVAAGFLDCSLLE